MNVLFVVRNRHQATLFNLALPVDSGIRAIWPSLSSITGVSAPAIIVNNDVDLEQDIEGEGELLDLLRKRQMPYPDASLVVLCP